MKDFGRKERMLFLNQPRSRAWWIFAAAAIGLTVEYWLRPLWH